MLKLINIVKDYSAGGESVRALKGVSIEFRRNEFVAILGQSGCGKTTLLNIIGGLDQYTSGDLQIDRKSTKKFKDADWDSYRNHSVGFVFQSYNLIPHQTVLANVELALTLSGVGKAERRRRAKEALEKVGLGDQLRKKPNQMSGGQMQRVAIARALVNDPEILLADEPTGALDSQTSVQIMDILKEISKDKLIIMVTHNPELAEQYASRTIRLLDGEVISDTDPYDGESDSDHQNDVKNLARSRKTSMSFFTAMSLSLNNLMTKKARTILTSFAGSIGIIGIALIMSVSTGVQNYINKVQEETLSSYPITINAQEVDMTSLMNSIRDSHDGDASAHELDAVYESKVMYEMMNSVNSMNAQENNLVKFKEFLETSDEISQYSSGIAYDYGVNLNPYITDPDGKIVKSDILELMSELYSAMGFQTTSSTLSNYMQIHAWAPMLSGMNGEPVNDLMKEQYDVVAGRFPESYDEVVVVVSEKNEISDMMLYALGLKTLDEIRDAMTSVASHETVDTSEFGKWSYEDILNLDFRLILDCDKYQPSGDSYIDISQTETGLKLLYDSDNAIKIKVVGIIRPNSSTILNSAIGYTPALADEIIKRCAESDILKAQIDNPEIDVISGLKFKVEGEEPTAEEIKAAADEWIGKLTVAEKAALYTDLASIPTDEYIASSVAQYRGTLDDSSVDNMLVQAFVAQTQMDETTVADYIKTMDPAAKEEALTQVIAMSVTQQYAQGVQAQLAPLPTEQVAALLDPAKLTEAQYEYIFSDKMPSTVSDSTYSDNLKLLGHIDPASPKSIYIYANTFENKDSISDAIAAYNDSVEKDDKIVYTDYVKLLMSSITTIISAISYVLIAFVAISLIVSSIMIGIITYISVLERTKEIGILRSVGASKKDVSRVFNAETLIVGFVAGALGIGITLLMLLPINAVLHALTDIENLSATLPIVGGTALVLISMVLTLIAGLIPSGIAAKKDPVVALRTE